MIKRNLEKALFHVEMDKTHLDIYAEDACHAHTNMRSGSTVDVDVL